MLVIPVIWEMEVGRLSEASQAKAENSISKIN
jgi:hypothetical protein